MTPTTKATIVATFGIILSVHIAEAAYKKKPSFGGDNIGTTYLNNKNYIHRETKRDGRGGRQGLFIRLESGCQLLNVESYRTFETTPSPGCSEAWQYNLQVVDANYPEIQVVSDALQLSACSQESCSTCEELKGESFHAIELEAFNVSSSNNFVDCYIPRDIRLIDNSIFNCSNDFCIFIDESYAFYTSGVSANALSSWYFMATVSFIFASTFSLFW